MDITTALTNIGSSANTDTSTHAQNNQSVSEISGSFEDLFLQAKQEIHPSNKTATPAEEAAEKDKQKEAVYSAEVQHALDLGLYEYMIEKKEEELRAKAKAQVLSEFGLSEETYAALPDHERQSVEAMIEERYQELRKALIEELIEQMQQQLQQSIQNRNSMPEEQPQGPPMALHFIPPAS